MRIRLAVHVVRHRHDVVAVKPVIGGFHKQRPVPVVRPDVGDGGIRPQNLPGNFAVHLRQPGRLLRRRGG
ncbi:hypothetical protein SDC9_69015 [bioreactor metagenome]|uniref:Uncharacterized protein n=1 Tax=bioreactor metagenome TaxID=1076179 RepID=A0A644Y3J7_9ZZZZ